MLTNLVKLLWKRALPAAASAKKPVRPQVEELESRIVPYATTGNLWPHPQVITISFAPDGTNPGDVTFNTGQTWNVGSNYDLFTVAMHEIGHALGLDHSTALGAVMAAAYGGVQKGLSSDDIAGIRNIYSNNNNPRASDSYDLTAS